VAVDVNVIVGGDGDGDVAVDEGAVKTSPTHFPAIRR
jgi:hypothetical protein